MFFHLMAPWQPVWSALSWKQRYFVWGKVIYPKIRHWKYALCYFGMVSAFLVPSFLTQGTLSAVLMGVAIIMPSEILDAILLIRSKQEVADFNAGHQTEIRAVK